jgi:hypothetical protein
MDLDTQWRTGPCGVTGLDYGVIPNVMRMRGLPRKQWPEVFDLIRVMEGVALPLINQR